MPHPSDGELLAWIDGELEPASVTRVEDHVGVCAVCRPRSDVLRRESEALSRALVVLDEELSGRSDPGPLPLRAAGGARRHPIRKTGWSLARAAGLVLVAAGAAAALVPGSPVRDWIDALVAEPVREALVPGDDVTPDATPGSERIAGSAGISVVSEAGTVVVKLRDLGHESNVHVRLTDGGRAAVRVEGAAESPRFVTGPGLLEAIGVQKGDIWVELPRSAGEAVVLVDGEVAVRVRDGQLSVFRPMLDSLRGEVVFRIGD